MTEEERVYVPETKRMATRFGDLCSFNVAAGKWQVYEEQMQFFFMANGLDDDKAKKAIFLSSCGTETYALLKSIATPENITDASFTFDKAITLLRKHFCPHANIIIQRFQFYRRDQQEEEEIPEYLAALRKLCQHCDFKDLDEMLRDRLVCGMRDTNLQKRLLANEKLTLEVAENEAIANEEAQKSLTTLKGSTNVPVVNRIGNRKVNKQDEMKRCFRCNGNHSADTCRFKNEQCFFCKKQGHIERACITKTKKKKTHHYQKHHRSSVNQVSDQKGGNKEYVLTVSSQSTSSFVREINIYDRPVKMEIDSGASHSIMSQRRFVEHFGKMRFEKSDIDLRTWGNDKKLSIVGKVLVPVSTAKFNGKLWLLVVSGDGPSLIGRNWFQDLGIQIMSSCNNIGSNVPEHIGEFESVFDESLGDYKGEKVKLHVKEGGKPRFYRFRPVPFALKPKIEVALQQMMDDKIIRPIKYSEWATPIVPVVKPDGSIRICGDYKCTVNQILCNETYPLPTNTEVFATLSNCKWFSSLDLDRAYTQVKVDEESAKILTLNTHKGLFEVTRLPFGISTAPSIFQRMMENIVGDVPGVVVYLDDILIGGSTMEEMWLRTKETLRRIQNAGLKLKKTKCVFAVPEITFLGFIINQNGVKPTLEKIKAVSDAPEPTNKQQLQAFLGLLNFYDRFFQNKADLLEPLYRLLKKDVLFRWGKEQRSSFSRAKEILKSEQVLVHYSPELPLILSGDASPYGVGAVLAHVMPDGREAPIAFGSRTLQPAEKNYSQLDKEALSIIFGIKKFHQYLCGRKFTIYTDHKPLLGLLNPSKPIPQHISPRLLRWSLMMGAYKYEIEYREGMNNQNADALSRLPLVSDTSVPPDYNVLYCIEGEEQFLVTAKEISNATRTDPILSKVIWHIQRKYKKLLADSDDLKPYAARVNELSVDGQCLLWGCRVIIPHKLRGRILAMLHEIHQGITAMKAIARSYFWWPGLDKDIEILAKGCEKCCQQSRSPPVAEPKSWPETQRPWSRLHLDYAGPFLGTNFLIVVDSHSKWVEVKMTKSITSNKTIELLREIFSTHGIPDTVVTDNGRNFISEEFEGYLKGNGIYHVRTAPYHPSSNGQAERFVQTVKNFLRKVKTNNLHKELSNILLRLRTTPNSSSNITPSEMLMGRKIKTLMDHIHPASSKSIKGNTPEKPVRKLGTGEKVWYRNYGIGEKWLPGTVQSTGSRNYEILDGDNIQSRHIDQLRTRLPDTSASPALNETSSQQVGTTVEPDQNIVPDCLPSEDTSAIVSDTATTSQETVSTSIRSRPARQRKAPLRYGDYLMGEEL
ncbi:uncharacterized protein K02A2.6 [Musca domestica]|uniref:RNA-directed DNA polymerase n=1 Tax=Musca domestica TaxID=7370 RepID=A0ABM3VJF1_MUSDO|nr:uncharacterized protein K02A2.6 [Musca domestica]